MTASTNFKFISREKLEACKKSLGEAKQLHSVFDFIVNNPFSLTHEIAAQGGSINVPHSVKKIRERIEVHGVSIINYLPANKVQNRFGNVSHLHRWYCEEIEK
jgi:hypothetical protein